MKTEKQNPNDGIEVPPNTVREKCQAQYRFTVEETAELGTRLSRSRKDYTRIEAELDSVKQDYKGRLFAVELEQDSLCRKLDDGFEMREATAIVTFNDPTRGRKTYRHEDTGEIIREEPMTHADWQLPMFRNPDGKDATAPAEQNDPVNADVVPETAADRAKNKEGAEFLNTEGEGTKEDLGGIEDVPNAGETPLNAALNTSAVNTKQPQMVIADFERDDWTIKALISCFRNAARRASWPEVAISTMRAHLLTLDRVAAVKDSLRPHVVSEAADAGKAIIQLAKKDYPDPTLLRAHFDALEKVWPDQYRGSFEAFVADIRQCVEDEINANRSAAE